MIKIVAKNQVIPEKKGEFIRIATALIQASQVEAGCVAYDLFVNLADENELTFIEEWVDQDAIERHGNSEHFTSLVPKLNALTLSSEVQLYKKA